MMPTRSRLGRAADRALRPFMDIEPGEGAAAFSMALLFFLVIGSYYLIKPVRNSLFVERVGADNLPFVYIGTALVIAVLISSYSRHVVDRVRPRRLVAGTYIFLASNLVLFWWLLRGESLATSAAFYIWAKIYSVLVVSQFWLLANLLFDPRQAKRLFGFVGAGGILGGIVGGTLAGATARVVGTENLLLASSAVTILCAGLAFALHGQALSPAAARPRTPREAREGGSGGSGGSDMRSAAALVRESPHLRAIAMILTLTIIVSTVVDWQMNKAVELFVPGEDAKTAFYGRFFAVLNGASFLVQVLFTSYVLRRFGIGVALLLLPIGMLTGSLGILVHPALWTAALAKGADGTLRYSLDQSTRELLFLPVLHDVKMRAKPFIDVAVQRGGTGLAGVLILVAAQVGDIPFRYLSLVSVAAIAAWIAITFVVRREYVGSIKRLIRARDVELEELVLRSLDADSRRELLGTLEAEDPNRVLYALGLLELAGDIPSESAHLAKLLRHPSQDVRERAAATLAKHGDEVLLRAIEPLLEDEDVSVRAEAVRIVCAHCVGDELMHFQRLLADPRPRVRAGAIAGFYGNPDRRLGELAETALQGLAEQPGPEGAVYRREAALLTAILPRSDATRRVLLSLLEDRDEAVRRAAILAAGRGRFRETVPALVRALAWPQTREEARAALATFGERILGTLADYLRDRTEPREIRIQVARVFVELPSPLAVTLLLGALEDPDPGVRYHVLKALNRLRRDHPELMFDPEPVESALRRELEVLADVQALRTSLAGSLEADGATLCARVLGEREDDAVERITRCLGLVYSIDELFHAYRAIATRTREGRGRGIELLDNVLRPAHRRAVLPPLERMGGAAPDRTREPSPRWKGSDPWLAACVAFAEFKRSGTVDAIFVEDPEMMTIVERADFLRQVEMFSLVRTDYLAKIAAIAKEKTFEPGAELFRQGSPPDAIYFVVEGEVRRLRDGEELEVATRGDAVGYLSVLLGQPTLVTAIARGPVRALYVEEEIFRDFMLDNPAVMLGIIRSLADEVQKAQFAARRGEVLLGA
ncbi:MAG: HEAT repeat domain-containing protein [Gemmatimonadetes bacterium]|nr:HEAT repeat domain-containing protein [Gemmatimonadota bacterium]